MPRTPNPARSKRTALEHAEAAAEAAAALQGLLRSGTSDPENILRHARTLEAAGCQIRRATKSGAVGRKGRITPLPARKPGPNAFRSPVMAEDRHGHQVPIDLEPADNPAYLRIFYGGRCGGRITIEEGRYRYGYPTTTTPSD